MSSDALDALQRLSDVPTTKVHPIEIFISKKLIVVMGYHVFLSSILFLTMSGLATALPLNFFAASLSVIGLISALRAGTFPSSALLILWSYAVVATFPASAGIFLIIVASCFATWAVVKGKVGKYSFWWVALYLPFVMGTGSPPFDIRHIFALLLIFGISSFFFFKNALWAPLIGALFGFVLALILEFRQYSELHDSVQLIILSVFVCAVAWYEKKLETNSKSELRVLVFDSLVAILSLVAALSVWSHGPAAFQFWGAGMILYAALRIIHEQFAKPCRLCWAVLGALSVVVFSPLKSEADKIFACLIIVWFLHLAALAANNRLCARFGAAVTIALLIYLLRESALSSPYRLTLSIAAAVGVVLMLWTARGELQIYWWQGIFRKRHVVFFLRSIDIAEKTVRSLPIIGMLVTLPRIIVNWLTYMRAKSTMKMIDDILSFSAQLICVLIIEDVLRAYIRESETSIYAFWCFRAVLWVLWGTGTFAVGCYVASPYHRMLGAMLIVVPLLMDVSRWVATDTWMPDTAEFYGQFYLIVGMGLTLAGAFSASIGAKSDALNINDDSASPTLRQRLLALVRSNSKFQKSQSSMSDSLTPETM